MTNWQEITPQQEEDKFWDFEQNPELIGKYKGVKENVGKNESNLYTIEYKDEDYKIWGTAVLDTRLKGIEPDKTLYIKYLGKEKSNKTGRNYKNFKVYHIPNEESEQLEENLDIPVIDDE